MVNVKGLADEQELVKILQDLVRIESINPGYKGSTVGEINVLKYVAAYMDANGIEYEIQDALPGRPNIVAKLPGKTPGGIIMEAHMDTVSVEGMTIPPFDPVIKDGLMYGRGSCDTKGSLACMMHAMALLKRNGIVPATDVYLAGAIDEELAYRGVVKLLEHGVNWKYGIIGEPTESEIVVACKGVIRFPLVCRGKAAHSSRPWEGHSAIHDMGEMLHVIKTVLIPEYMKKTHPMLGYSTINVGVIEGGELINIVPAECRVEIDVRALPGQTYDQVKADFEREIAKLKADDPTFDCTVEEPLLLDYAMETAQDSPIVTTAVEVSKAVQGKDTVKAVYFDCDGTTLDRAGVPNIVLGPGSINQAHSAVEFVEIAQLTRCAELYAGICADIQV